MSFQKKIDESKHHKGLHIAAIFFLKFLDFLARLVFPVSSIGVLRSSSSSQLKQPMNLQTFICSFEEVHGSITSRLQEIDNVIDKFTFLGLSC